MCLMYETWAIRREVGKGVSGNLSPQTSGLSLGTVSPGLRVETPVGNQVSTPGLCAGMESEIELLPNCVAIPS